MKKNNFTENDLKIIKEVNFLDKIIIDYPETETQMDEAIEIILEYTDNYEEVLNALYEE